MLALVGVGEGRWVPGSGMHRKVVPLRAPRLGANRGIAARERPRVSARSHVAQRDARAPGPAPTHPTTRPATYLDVPSLLERTASVRCRLPVHVDEPPVLSEARRWV